MLYRFREAMLIEAGVKRNPNDKEPLIPETTTRVGIAEQARKDLVREISRKISRIQDQTIDEDVVRQLNDEINDLLKQKYAWDQRIHELGGIERKSVQLADKMGVEAPNVHQYQYFGRAKDLPGVKEALEPYREDQTSLAREKEKLFESVDQSYYGFDEESESQSKAEKGAEEEYSAFEGPLADWVSGLPTILPKGVSMTSSFETCVSSFTPAHIPDQREVQSYLLQQRKAKLLEKFDNL